MRWKFEKDKYKLVSDNGAIVEFDGQDLMIMLTHSDLHNELIEKYYENLPLSERNTALDYSNIRYKYLKDKVNTLSFVETYEKENVIEDFDDEL